MIGRSGGGTGVMETIDPMARWTGEPLNRLVLAASMVLPPTSAATRAPAVTPVDPPAAPGSLAPNLAVAGETVLLSWLEPTAPGGKPGETPMALRFAAFDGQRWNAPRTVVSSPKILANWA